jgi:hypothetical protein
MDLIFIAGKGDKQSFQQTGKRTNAFDIRSKNCLQKTIYHLGRLSTEKWALPGPVMFLADRLHFMTKGKVVYSDSRHILEGKQDVFVKYLGVEV